MSTQIERSALLPYSAQAMFELVNDVARYPEFLPWCAASEVLESTETLMRGRLTVAKGGIKQSFVTRNQLVPGKSITMELEEGPFKKLHGQWQFQDMEGIGCRISLDLCFDYAGTLIRMALGPIFNQAASKMVDAFSQRARQLYGQSQR